MKREVKKLRKGLKKGNRKLFNEIIANINSYSLNSYQVDDIYEELLGMFLESESKNEYLSNVIGSDTDKFCKELTKNAKRKTFLEKIINFLYWSSLFFMFISIIFVVFNVTTGINSLSYFKGKDLYVSVSSIINVIGTTSVIIIFKKLDSRNIFNKKIRTIICIIYIIIYTFIYVGSLELLDRNKFIVISAIPYFISITVITILLFLLDKYIAKRN